MGKNVQVQLDVNNVVAVDRWILCWCFERISDSSTCWLC